MLGESNLWQKPRIQNPVRINPRHRTNHGLLCWLPMNEVAGGTMYDLCGRNQGRIVAPSWNPLTSNGPGLTFDPFDGNNYVTISPNNFPTAAAPRTFNAWVQITDSYANYSTLLFYGTMTTGQRMGWYIIKTAGYVGTAGCMALELSGATRYTTNGNVGLTGQIVMLTCTAYGICNNTAFYVNGSPWTTSGSGNQNTALATPAGTSAYLAWGTDTTGSIFSGNYFDFQVWDRVLPPEEIRRLYYEPYGTKQNPRLLNHLATRTRSYMPFAGASPAVRLLNSNLRGVMQGISRGMF